MSKKTEYELFGWIMWDKDDPNGFDDNSFFVFGRDNPAAPESEQRLYGGDHQGHVWDSMPLYRVLGTINSNGK